MAQTQVLEGTVGTEQTGNSNITGPRPHPPNPGELPHLSEPPYLSQLLPHTEDSPCCPCQSCGSGRGWWLSWGKTNSPTRKKMASEKECHGVSPQPNSDLK